MPPLTEQDVAEEVKAARKARNAQDASAVPTAFMKVNRDA